MGRPHSLAYQNAWRLALIFVLFELLAAAAVVFLLMLPLAHRASADFAALMVLSSQTWVELPPDTRPLFEREVERAYGLRVSQQRPAGDADMGWRGPYLENLEGELLLRLGRPVELCGWVQVDGTWYWGEFPAGDGTLWLGFPRERVGPHPLLAVALTALSGLLLAALSARWLARRAVAPLRRLGVAATQLGRGEMPTELPETGPTELAELARRFNQLTQQVRELLEARTTLLAGLSHDLRTPMARLRLAFEMMVRRPDHKWIRQAETDIEEMNSLIGELLDLAHGFVREPSSEINIELMLSSLADALRASGRMVELNIGVELIVGPPKVLLRAVGNLLENARRYSEGPIELRVERTNVGVRLGVLDRGPGIPENQLETVFRPFHRVDSSRSAYTGGSGLGLAIVRQLAQAQGWQVRLGNRKGGGLEAWIEMADAIHGTHRP